jgi:hypothetical protein
MTEQEALAMAREAMQETGTQCDELAAVMAELNRRCVTDRRLMEAFLIVGQMVVSGKHSTSH